MNKELPLCSFRCQDLLLGTIRTNDVQGFGHIVGHIGKNNLTVDTIKIGETIAQAPLSNKPQWLGQLRTIQKQRFSHQVLQEALAKAQRDNDVPTTLFVFNELYDHHNLQSRSVLLEIFPFSWCTRQVLAAAPTPEIEDTLPKMLEVCGHNQCRHLILYCLNNNIFTYIDAFAPQIDLDFLAKDIQERYNNGDTTLEDAVAYFQSRTLRLALKDDQFSNLQIKRKI